MIDVKHQLKPKKVNSAFDLGLSVTTVSTSFTDVFSVTLYPAFLIGKDFWYCGAKGTICFSDLDSEDELSLFPFISGASLVTGLKVGNDHIKFLLELDILVLGSFENAIIPACGFYVGF